MKVYNEKLDFFHNLYSLIFCIQIIYFTSKIFMQNNFDNALTIYNDITLISYKYFIISSIINLIDKNFMYLVHHFICLIVLSYGYYVKEPFYIYWISKTLLAEFSTIFLSFSKIIRFLNTSGYNVPNQILNFSDKSFVYSYYIFRIMYLVPLTIYFLSVLQFEGFKIILWICSLIMIGFNLYWAWLIYTKIICKNDVKNEIKKYKYIDQDDDQYEKSDQIVLRKKLGSKKNKKNNKKTNKKINK